MKTAPKHIPLLLALWGINRRARRSRDQASALYEGRAFSLATWAKGEKDTLYGLKGQALHWLVQSGELVHAGYHRFGDNWAEVLAGGGFTSCEVTEAENLGESLEVKPKSSGEPRYKDARHTIEDFLSGRERVYVYQWPARSRFGNRPMMQCACGNSWFGYSDECFQCGGLGESDDDDDYDDNYDESCFGHRGNIHGTD